MSNTLNGDDLTKLGLRVELEDGDLIAGVVVVAKVISENGNVTVTVQASDGTSWLDQLALIAAAHNYVQTERWHTSDDDDSDQ